jgi:glucose dehydrogenase
MLLTAGKTGILWALDRQSGKFLWSTETVSQNVIARIDPQTGAVTVNEAVKPQELDRDYFVCPSLYGGRIWQASAYNPRTRALYMPLANMCNDYKLVQQEPTPGEDFGRGRFTPRHAPGTDGKVGRVEAIDVTTGRSLWKHERRIIGKSRRPGAGSSGVSSPHTSSRITSFRVSTAAPSRRSSEPPKPSSRPLRTGRPA